MYLDEKVSLSKAADIAGMSTIEFKDVLAGKGIIRATEGKSAKEMDKKIKKIFK
jgi:predicted HTH domain antitoxin